MKKQKFQASNSDFNRLPHEMPPRFSRWNLEWWDRSHARTLRKAASHTKCLPDCYVGTLNSGTILTPEPSGNRLPHEMHPRFLCWNLECWDHSHARTFRKPPPTQNASEIFMLEPWMVGTFSRRNLQKTASHTKCFPDFYVGTLNGGAILTPEPSGNRVPHKMHPRFSS